MARKYVVIDTNVLVSALITRNESSPTVQILRFLATGNIVPVYSDEIVKEYNEVLRRAKFKHYHKSFEGYYGQRFEISPVAKS